MLNWVARILLYIGGVIASWFIAEDANNFAVAKFVASLAFFVLLVSVVTFRQPLLTLLAWLKKRRRLESQD